MVHHLDGIDEDVFHSGVVHWGVYWWNLDGSAPRCDLFNALEDTLLEILARVGGSR